jgi:hypothetical protein
MNLLKIITGSNSLSDMLQRGEDVSSMEGYLEQIMFEFRQDNAADVNAS